jgi:AAA15 family ATPase/GTPase
MKIKEITIKGWRSFDYENGIILKDLKRINVIIGPNNSGKSNVGKYFFKIKQLIGKIKDTFRPEDYNLFSRIN